MEKEIYVLGDIKISGGTLQMISFEINIYQN
jgi:hypothetical protein